MKIKKRTKLKGTISCDASSSVGSNKLKAFLEDQQVSNSSPSMTRPAEASSPEGWKVVEKGRPKKDR
jgi:hypothetical protein